MRPNVEEVGRHRRGGWRGVDRRLEGIQRVLLWRVNERFDAGESAITLTLAFASRSMDSELRLLRFSVHCASELFARWPVSSPSLKDDVGLCKLFGSIRETPEHVTTSSKSTCFRCELSSECASTRVIFRLPHQQGR